MLILSSMEPLGANQINQSRPLAEPGSFYDAQSLKTWLKERNVEAYKTTLRIQQLRGENVVSVEGFLKPESLIDLYSESPENNSELVLHQSIGDRKGLRFKLEQGLTIQVLNHNNPAFALEKKKQANTKLLHATAEEKDTNTKTFTNARAAIKWLDEKGISANYGEIAVFPISRGYEVQGTLKSGYRGAAENGYLLMQDLEGKDKEFDLKKSPVRITIINDDGPDLPGPNNSSDQLNDQPSIVT